MSLSPRALRRPSRLDLLVAAAVLAVGCGGKVVLDSSSGSSSGTAGAGGGSDTACDIMMAGTHVCEQVGAAEATEIQSACASAGGTLLSACSDTNRFGTCEQTAGGITLSTSYYPGDGLTAAAAQSACMDAAGTWTAG